ncbi:hypothetical protein [Fontivita pretiosa]|uniref:hypothetical protein n=1 Tax=Fontivita pretiosa TaxID=2989684 RepID=UPI003D165DF9
MSRPSRRKLQRHHARPRTSLRFACSLLLSVLLTIGILLGMFMLDIPLGERGRMEYRYSLYPEYRFLQAVQLIVAIGACALVIILLGRKRSRRAQRSALVLFTISLSWMCAWTWYAPPKPAVYHGMNLYSPSHDGAFVFEAEQAGPIAQYLRDFPRLLHRSPEQMLGTRVLSNPPGMTVLVRAVQNLWPFDPDRPGLIDRLLLDSGDRPDLLGLQALRMRVSIVLTALWGISGLFAYLLGRLVFSRAGAVVFCLLVTFNPATVHFSPGKDPMQLLTINAMLWAWFAGYRRDQPQLSLLAGMLLVVGLVFGLIHFWIALAALSATLWIALRQKRSLWYTFRRHVLPAISGCLLVVVIAFPALGWNIPATLLGVAQRFAQIQHTIRYSRPLWFFIGLPLFVLFLSPTVMAMLLLRRRLHRIRGLGTPILVSTVAIMLLTYLIGVTYELPRLWIAFLPLLTLGICADQPLLKSDPARRAVTALIILLTLHIASTALHFSLLDPREAEYRLSTRRYFD